MSFQPVASQSLQLDVQALGQLKTQAAKDPKTAIQGTAKQLESLFMQELIKTMRHSTLNSGWLDNNGSQMGTDMLDQEWATQLSGMPNGLSKLIQQQLNRQLQPATPTGIQAAQPPTSLAPATGSTPNTPASAFVRQHHAAAQAIEAETGIPAAHLLGQAAHESGWGKREIKTAEGRPSYNLFGIKAGANWSGKVAEVTTTEYIGGTAHRVTAKFRAYDSYEAAFRDHARLITTNPRYSQVAHATTVQDYAQHLQQAGYATDPAYASKLTRVINTALRLQRGLT